MALESLARSASALVLVCVNAATAQQLVLTVAALPGRTEMRVDGAAPGELVATLVAPAPDPANELGLPPDRTEVFGVAAANEHGSASFAVTYDADRNRGLAFVARAVRLAPGPFAPTPAGMSPIATVTVPEVGAAAAIVVLFGQSNAEGHADGSALPPTLLGPQPAARMWQEWTGSFAAIEHGVNTRSYGPAAWCGPELTLAHALTTTGRVLYLLKVAAPGATLGPSPGPWSEWNPGAGELYAVLLHRLDAAADALRAQGLRPHVGALCMMQGESDATDARLARTYRDNLAALFAALQRDLHQRGLAGAVPPAVALGLVHPRLSAAAFPFVDEVRRAQHAAALALPRGVVVETADLTFRPDGVHFDLAGVTTLGQRFTRAIARQRP